MAEDWLAVGQLESDDRLAFSTSPIQKALKPRLQPVQLLRFAIPDNEYLPTVRPQVGDVLRVTLDISIKLRLPIAPIRFWTTRIQTPRRRMLVPKASMNKNDAPGWGENEIGFSR